MSLRKMDNESENSQQSRQNDDSRESKPTENKRKTRSSTRVATKVIKQELSDSESLKDSDSHQNSPDSSSGSGNELGGGRVEVDGIKQSTRIKKKSMKVLEAEMNMKNNNITESLNKETVRGGKKTYQKRGSVKGKPKLLRRNNKHELKKMTKIGKVDGKYTKTSNENEDDSSD
jgi:hypothetical protein